MSDLRPTFIIEAADAKHVRVRNMTTGELVTVKVAVEREPVYTITIVPEVETETIPS